MSLLDRLRDGDKKGYFKTSSGKVYYPTGFTTIDYRNGQIMKVYNDDNEVVDTYLALGVQDGSITTLVSETGVGKTSLISVIAYNIVKPFNEGVVFHLDIESSFSLGRVKDLTGMSRKELNSKYVLVHDKLFLDDIVERIKLIHDEKIKNKDIYEYDTGYKDIFGNNIIKFQPTVVIIDSLKAIATNEDKIGEMEGATSNQRKAQSITMFVEKINVLCNNANIIVLIINHVKTLIDMGFSKTKAQLSYMHKRNKTIPGGDAALYLSSNVWYIDTVDKYTEEVNGFSGRKCKLWIWKSRSNIGGTCAPMVFNQEYGFDDILAMYNVILDHELILGRNPKRYIEGYPDIKFDDRILFDELCDKQELCDVIGIKAKELMYSWLSGKGRGVSEPAPWENENNNEGE